MDMTLDEEQEMLKRQARDFFKKECPSSVVRDAETSSEGYSKELYLKMAHLGWLGLGIPEKWGGTGGDLIALAILYEEIGRALVPGPHFVNAVICGQLILDCGSEEQRKAFLPQIAGGRLLLTLARHERDDGYSASSINLPATLDRQGYVLEGIKLFVPYAHICDYLVCVSRTQKNRTPERGITLFLVDAKSAGISYTPLITIAGDKQSEVMFEKVAVSADNILGKPHDGWSALMHALEKATVIQCAQMVGGAEKVLEIAVDYAKSRVQFERPIGSFQAIQHKCADMALAVHAAKYITYDAACRLNDGSTFPPEVAMAKAYVAPAYRQVTKEAHQILAGAGFVMDHDMNLYYRRAKALEIDLGDVDYHVKEVARRISL